MIEICAKKFCHRRRDGQSSRQVIAGETGWRVGRVDWLHNFVDRRATSYAIDPSAAAPLLGLDGAHGCGDGYSICDRCSAAAQEQCLAHLARRCDLLVTAPGAESCLPGQTRA